MESQNIMKENEKVLKNLAEQMFINHIRSSIDLKLFKNEFHEISVNVDSHKRKRVIVVVGAAASYEAAVPDSKKAIDILDWV